MLLVLPLLLVSCKVSYPVAQQSGKEDVAYLLFVSSNQYAGKDVQVSVDNAQPFEARVVKESKSYNRGTKYGIATGTKNLNVSFEGKTIYSKKIFVSTQEVKQIILP